MKTCNVWAGLSIVADTRDLTRARARTYLGSDGGRFNYLWFLQNLRDGIEARVSLDALRAAAFKQRKVEAREPNWDRLKVMRRLYGTFKSKCSDPYIPDVQLAGGYIEFQPVVVRQDLRDGTLHLVVPQPRRTGLDMQEVLPMLFFCARNYLLLDAREQLLPSTSEEHIGVEVPDLGNDNPRVLRYLREAHIYTESEVKRIDSAQARQRLKNFEEVWPEEVKQWLEKEAERKRDERRRDDPWPPGSLFDPEK